MRTEFIYSLAALSAIPVVANADAEAYKADKVQTVGTASDVELAVGNLAKGNYTVTSAAISGANLTVKVMAGGVDITNGGKTFDDGKEISLNFVAENPLEDVKIVLVHTTKTVTVPAPVVTLKFDFAGIANKLQIEHNKLTQALAGYEYDKSAENTAAVGYYDRIMAIAAADYKFYVDNTEGVQDLYADLSKVTGMVLYKAIQGTFNTAKDNEKAYQEKTLGGGNGLLGQYDKTYEDLKTPISYVTDALTNAQTAAWDAYNKYIEDVTNFDNRTAAKNAIAAYKTALDAVVTVKNDNEGANTDLNKALNSVYVYGADNSYYAQTLKAIETNYADEDGRYAELKGELTTALAAIVGGKDYTDVQTAINTAYTNKTAKADKNTLINQIAAFKQKITQKVSDFNALKDQLAAAYTTYDEQLASANELIKDAPDDLDDEKKAVEKAVADLKTFIEANDTEKTIGNLTQDAIGNLVNVISAKKVAYSDKKALYDKYTAVKASVDAKATALTTAANDADTYAKETKKLDENVFKPSTIWASTIIAINQEIGNLLKAVKADDNKWNAAEYETTEEFKNAMAKIQTDIDDFATNAQSATDLYATIAGQVKSAGDEKDKTLAIEGIDKLNVWTNQVTTDPAIQARTPYNTVINTITGHITDWGGMDGKLKTATGKTGQYNPDPQADNTDNILGYLQFVLKDLGGDASKVLADDIATLKAIQENWAGDEQAFSDQIDQQQIAGMKTMINTKAEQFEPMIAALQADIDNGNKFGKIKGGLLQTEINAISQKINDAKAVAAKQDATKAEVTAAYNAIKNLDNTDIAVAQTNANTYKDAFTAFTTNYNNLNGNKDNDQYAGTVYGLKAKVKAQKDDIDAKTNLSPDQKTALKAKVDAVEVVKQEGDPAVDVTYTIATIDEFIKEAWQNEELTDAEVTKYWGIMSELKEATNIPAIQADRLNVLEGNLAAIDFNAAKTAILAKDPNTEGFFVVDKLLGDKKAGQCTFDFNALKSTIEADENITDADKNTYNNQIDDLNDVINGLPDLALANLNALEAAKVAYSNDEPEAIAAKGAVQRYEYYVATLKAERQTTALEGQLATLATLKEALDQLKADAEAHYAAGTASATDEKNIKDKANEIKGKFDEYYNEVNYNAQVAADNLAQYNLIKDAKATVQGTYDVAASVINTYKNFKSDELKEATAAAQTELQNLLDYLVGYDALVSGDKGIQTRADAAYNAVVSPEKFDGTSYIAEYQDVNEQITNLKKALTDKIEPLFKDAVSKSVNSYSEAITSSKAKVAKFTATDADQTEAQLNALYATIDKLLKDVNDVKDDADKLAELDARLAAAANATTGIKASITTVEQDQAKTALVALRGDIPAPTTNLQGTDLQSYYTLNTRINSTSAYNKKYRVNNFSTMKAELQRLKAVAEKYAADQVAIGETTDAIKTAETAVNGLVADYGKFAAGFEVKADVEAVQAELAKYPVDGITAENAEAWKTAAEAIPGAVTEVYNKLFDKEDAAIKDLIKQAKEENLTYKYEGTDAELTKEALSAKITAEEGKLTAAETDVARDSEDAQYKTKKDALTDGTYANNLKAIEGMLNSYIKTMTDGNGTNINQAIIDNLNATKTAQTNRLNSLYNSIADHNTARYKDVTNTWHYYSTDEVVDAKNAILKSIGDVQNYIGAHELEIAAYEAMQADINTALDNFETLVNTEKEKQYLAFVAADNQMIADAWKVSDDAIADAQTSISFMDSQLSQYGSADQYANKVGKLRDQVTAANTVLADAKTAAESLNTLRDKYVKANSTINDVDAELAGVANNCTEIIGMAKQAYIDAFIAGLNAQIIADTWTNSSNYTATDKATLTGEREALVQTVEYLKDNAEGCDQAEDIYEQTAEATIVTKGVITTLNEGADNFATDLAQLKQDLKDMSLAEDVKGHIVPGKDEIDTDDMEALADIILNGEEATADLARCDVNGDGDVDVTDLVWLRYFLVHGEWPNAQAAAPALYTFGNGGINNVTMEATANGNITRVAVNLTNETEFKHFQLNLQLPMGAKVVGQRLGERVEGANLLIAQNDNEVRMLAVSTANNVFAGNEGAVVYLDIENLTGDVTIEKVIFVDTALNGHRLNAGETTGIADRISNAIENAGQKIYDLGGRLMNSVKKGINIIRNADGSTKKVINK